MSHYDKPMTKIKICGIKTLTEALVAIEAGADYLGFNFYRKSVRLIEKKQCLGITSVLQREHPQIKLVGVFVNSSYEDVNEILNACSLDLAQLHGDEPPAVVKSFHGRAFKAIRLSPSESSETYVIPFLKSVRESVHPFAKQSVDHPAFLVDASVKGVYGGSGVTADWNGATELAKKYPLLLAGGLTPENVAESGGERSEQDEGVRAGSAKWSECGLSVDKSLHHPEERGDCFRASRVAMTYHDIIAT
jgi:phosphoribosylanthranilate isomerase